jgi:hypothetical protein
MRRASGRAPAAAHACVRRGSTARQTDHWANERVIRAVADGPRRPRSIESSPGAGTRTAPNLATTARGTRGVARRSPTQSGRSRRRCDQSTPWWAGTAPAHRSGAHRQTLRCSRTWSAPSDRDRPKMRTWTRNAPSTSRCPKLASPTSRRDPFHLGRHRTCQRHHDRRTQPQHAAATSPWPPAQAPRTPTMGRPGASIRRGLCQASTATFWCA